MWFRTRCDSWTRLAVRFARSRCSRQGSNCHPHSEKLRFVNRKSCCESSLQPSPRAGTQKCGEAELLARAGVRIQQHLKISLYETAKNCSTLLRSSRSKDFLAGFSLKKPATDSERRVSSQLRCVRSKAGGRERIPPNQNPETEGPNGF